MIVGDSFDPIPDGVVLPYLNVRGQQFFDNSKLEQADAATGDGNVAINSTLVFAFNGNSVRDELVDQKVEMRDRLLEIMFE